jgi:TetR/AcrR family transcriptional repressor of mexJK operon
MVRASAPRVDKGEAILAAALQVFGHDGFGDGKVEDVARLAGVAKPTVYSRFGDKRTLFTEAVNFGVARSGARILAAIDSLDLNPADVRVELERLGRELVGCVAHAEGAAVIRLQLTERPRFPEIIDPEVNRQRAIDALAGKLAQLAATGHLRLRDPRRAARQLLALVTDDALALSGFGNRVLAEDEYDGSVRDGVDTFLAAFGVREERSRPAPTAPTSPGRR